MPPFPEAAAYLWRAYRRLRRRKGASDMGTPKPIEWPDIDAFVRRSGLHLRSWEVEIIEAIDDIYMAPGEPKPTAPDGQAVTIAASASDADGVRAVLGSVGKRRVVKRKGN